MRGTGSASGTREDTPHPNPRVPLAEPVPHGERGPDRRARPPFRGHEPTGVEDETPATQDSNPEVFDGRPDLGTPLAPARSGLEERRAPVKIRPDAHPSAWSVARAGSAVTED